MADQRVCSGGVVGRLQVSGFKCKVVVGMLAVAIVLLTGTSVFLFNQASKYYALGKIQAALPYKSERYILQNEELMASPDQEVAVMFGDSRILQWAPLPRVDGLQIVNRGGGGETTSQLRGRFEADVLNLRPSLVIFQMGINDLVAASLVPREARNVIDRCKNNIRAMVDEAEAQGIRVLLLTIIPPSNPGIVRRLVWHDEIFGYVVEVNRYLRALSSNEGVAVVDTRAALMIDNVVWRSGVNRDPMHLTPRGYELLNQAVAAGISP